MNGNYNQGNNAMQGQQYEGELDWNSEINQDAMEFEILPSGEYQFRVEKYERGRFSGSEKMGACSKAMITLVIKSPTTGNDVSILHNLFLHTKTQWTIGAFFGSIGLKSKGVSVQPDWNRVPGATGVCVIGTKTYNNNTYNEVKSFVHADDVKQPNQQQQPQGYTPGQF